jgi:hypothetical protein
MRAIGPESRVEGSDSSVLCYGQTGSPLSLSGDTLKVLAPLGVHALFDCRDQIPGRRDFDVMALGAAQDWARDRIQFRRAALLDIFLHRAAHVARHLRESSDDSFGIEICTFRYSNRACLANAGHAQIPPVWIRQYLAGALVRSGCGQGEWAQEYEFAPH